MFTCSNQQLSPDHHRKLPHSTPFEAFRIQAIPFQPFILMSIWLHVAFIYEQQRSLSQQLNNSNEIQ